MDGEKRGPIAGWTGALHSWSVQTHLTAVCSLHQQHTDTHTHALSLTVGTITLLRGINRGLKEKVKRVGFTDKQCWMKTTTEKHKSGASGWVDNLFLANNLCYYVHQYAPTCTHICLAKGGRVVLFHRGSRVVITDLPALYGIAQTHTETQIVTQACMHIHTFTILYHQLFCPMPTTHRLKSWCCKAKTSHHISLTMRTHTHTHPCQSIKLIDWHT